MFNDIGTKLKVVAIIFFILEAVASFWVGISLLDEGELTGILFLIIGPLLGWISACFIYGFGEIIDKICDIERNTRNVEIKSKAKCRIDKLEQLRTQGVINEEEYQIQRAEIIDKL